MRVKGIKKKDKGKTSLGKNKLREMVREALDRTSTPSLTTNSWRKELSK